MEHLLSGIGSSGNLKGLTETASTLDLFSKKGNRSGSDKKQAKSLGWQRLDRGLVYLDSSLGKVTSICRVLPSARDPLAVLQMAGR
jgi:hypothetical protein